MDEQRPMSLERRTKKFLLPIALTALALGTVADLAYLMCVKRPKSLERIHDRTSDLLVREYGIPRPEGPEFRIHQWPKALWSDVDWNVEIETGEEFVVHYSTFPSYIPVSVTQVAGPRLPRQNEQN